MHSLDDLEKQLSKQLGKKYRYLNLVSKLANPDCEQKIAIAQQVLQEQDLGVFGAALEYQKWCLRR